MQSGNSGRGAGLARYASLSRLWAILMLLVFLVSAPIALYAQENPSTGASIEAISTDFRQCANNGAAGLGNCDWINSILQGNNSIYYENMGVPQRAMFTGIPAQVGDLHWLTFRHQATKGGAARSHAYDWLVSYDQAIALAASMGVPYNNLWGQVCNAGIPNSMVATCNNLNPVSPTFAGFCVDVAVPDDPYLSQIFSIGTGSYQARIDAFEAAWGNRTVRLCGNAPITAAAFTPLGLIPPDLAGHSQANDAAADDYIYYRLNWTSTSTEILLLLAGHLASSSSAYPGWGMPYGAGNISGGPYHFSLERLDGASLGAQDNQIRGGDILQLDFTVAKTGPAQSKVGDAARYTVVITNTGDATLSKGSIIDSLAGNLDTYAGVVSNTCGATLAPGATCTIVYNYTVPPGAPDSLVNTVTANYGPVGGTAFARSSTHTVNLFQPSVTLTKTGPADSAPGATVTYNVTIANTSSADSPTLVLDSFSDSLVAGVTLPAACSPLAPGASCSTSYTYVVQPGDPDPLLNTATVHYHPTGFTNDITASAGHSVNLFQPCVALTKTGDGLSKPGDTVTYNVAINNCSSADAPNLLLDSFSDTLVPGATLPPECSSLAPGASCSTSYTYVVQPGDPDPLLNTATVHYHLAGFTQDVSSSAGHSVNLFQPCVALTKTGDATSTVGATVTYNVTINNCSSADSPTLLLDSFSDTLVPGATLPAACSTLAPGASCSTSYTYVVQPGDPDPLLNTATVHYHPDGFTNDITATASWRVDLLQPGLRLTKTCDAFSKVADQITCVVTIQNTAAAGTPALILDSFSDTKAPGVVPPAACSPLAPGTSCSFSYVYTVQPTDPDPVVNTATVHLHPEGAANDVSDSAFCSTDLLHPNFTVTKACTTPVVNPGANAVFTISFANTGDVDLLVRASEDLTLANCSVIIAAGTPFTLKAGTTETYRHCVVAGNPPSVANTVNASATLPSFYGLTNVVQRTSSGSCTVVPRTEVPEASTLILLASGLAGLAGYAGIQIRARRRVK